MSNSKLGSLARPLLAITLCISVVAGLSGCAALLVGGAVGGAISISDRRTSGAQVEDAAIEIKGVNRITSNFGDAVHVDVNSYNRKVLLTGEVKDEATKQKVEDTIKGIENVQSVVNELQVSLFLPSFSDHSSDAYITTKVKTALLNTPDIYSSSFKVITEAGVVYLMGRVSMREGTAGADAARGVSGVKKVVKVFEYIDESDIKNYVPKPETPAPNQTTTNITTSN